MARLEIKLLGPFQVTLEGEAVSNFDSDKVRALLAYLAVEADRPVRREKLAGLLWPDFAESSARTNLRQALANLRRALRDQEANPPVLLPTRQTIQFNQSSNHTLDIHAFTTLAAGEQGRAPAVEDLEQAVALYQGEFLQGFSLPDAATFEEWALVTRESLQRQALRALHHLVGFYEEQTAYEQALGFAYRQLELDPFQEAAHQQVMRLLAQSGQRNEALSHYQDYRQLLQTELGVLPLEQTQAMYEQLQSGDLPGPAAPTVILRREPRAVGASPYRGLAAFREEDAPFFFGREDFTARLVEAVHSKTLISVIVGPSGSGKSSTVFSGLLPHLRAQNEWLIVQCRPRGQPFHSLAAALIPALEPDLNKTDQLIEANKLAGGLEEGLLSLYNTVLNALEARDEHRRCLLVIDQFEELYTLCPEPDVRRNFLDILLTAAEAGAVQRLSPIVLILTLRADFVGQALAHRPFADALQDGTLILGPMNRDELRAAIALPAEKQGAAFEAGLVERILDDVGEEPGNLPLLEFALTLLWEHLDQGWLTHQSYEDIGRVQGALARYADEAYATLNPAEQAHARRALIQLVQPGEGTEDTRRVATRAEFDEDTWELIQHLADERLVVTGSDEAGQDTAEVVHEALIRGWGRLQEWMAEDRAFRLWQERLRTAVRGWEDSGRDAGALLRGAPLAEAENWLNERKGELSPLELEFIQAGMDERRRVEESARMQQARERALERAALRRLRIIVGVLVAASIMGITLTIGIFNQSRIARRTAEENVVIANARATQQAIAEEEARARATQQAIAERNEAEARSLALAASARLALNAGESDLAIALAMEANRIPDPPAQTQLALADAAYAPGTRTLLEGHVANRIYSLSISPDTSRALSGALDRSMILWDLEAGKPLQRYGGFRGSVTRVSYPPAGKVTALGVLDGSVRLLDLETGEEVKRILHQPPFVGAALSPDGLAALWVTDAGNMLLLDLERQITLREFGEPPGEDFSESVSVLAYLPDGARAVTGHVNGRLKLWDLESGREVRSFGGGSAAIEDLAIAPDGQRVLSADANGAVTYWDLSSGDRLGRYVPVAIRDKVYRIAALPDGDRAIFGAMDGGLIVWELSTGEEIARLGDTGGNAGHAGWVSTLEVSADGKMALSGGTEGALLVWDLATGALRQSIQGIESRFVGTPLLSLDLSSDGRTALAGYENGVIVLWDLDSGQMVGSYSERTWNVESVAFEPDERSAVAATIDGRLSRWNMDSGAFETLFERAPAGWVLLSVSADGRTALSAVNPVVGSAPPEDLLLLDLDRGQVLQRLSGAHSAKVTAAALSPDGGRAFSGDDDGVIALWDLEEGAVIGNLPRHADAVLDLAFSPDGSSALSSANDGGMVVWDLATRQALQELPIVLNAESVAFGPDGSTVFAALSNGEIQLWDVATGQEVDIFAAHSNIVWDFELADDGSVALSSSEDGTVRVWDLTSGASVGSLDWPEGQFVVSISPDGGRALTGVGADILYWDAETEEVLMRLEGHDQPVFYIAFSPDGRRAVSSAGDPFADDPSSLIYWDLENGQALQQLDWEVQLYNVAISPDGRYAVVGSNTNVQTPTLLLWDLATGEVIDRFQTGPEYLSITSVALSPDGETVLAGLLDDPLQRDWVRLYDFETGELLETFVGHEFSVIDMAYLPDGTGAVSASWDRSLILWDLENGELAQRMAGQNAELFSVAVDPDGRFALAGAGDGHLILWDLQTGETIRNYEAHFGPVVNVAFNPEGAMAVSSGVDGQVRLWRIDRTVDDLVEWVRGHRYVRELTCGERALYQVDPLCE